MEDFKSVLMLNVAGQPRAEFSNVTEWFLFCFFQRESVCVSIKDVHGAGEWDGFSGAD